MMKSKIWKRAVSLIVTLALAGTSVPGNHSNVKTAQAVEGDPQAQETPYSGPIIGQGGEVTFQYKGSGTETSVQVKGSWNWDDSNEYVNLTKGEDNVWTGTTTLSLDQSYEYGFMVTEGTSTTAEWNNDTANPSTSGNSKINRNPQNNLDGSVTLYYYPKAGTTSVNGNVLYRVKGSTGDYTEVPLEKDATYTSIYSANITNLENGTYEYKYSINGEVENEVNAPAPEFTCIGEIPAENKDTKSGVVSGNKVTFAYYAPFAKEVLVAGNFTDWASNAIKATYNAATGYWNAEATLAP